MVLSAGPVPVAKRDRRTKGKLRWLPSTKQLRSRILANGGSVVGRVKQTSLDHLVGLRELRRPISDMPAIMATPIPTTNSDLLAHCRVFQSPWHR
jgi:hypothetical protein